MSDSKQPTRRPEDQKTDRKVTSKEAETELKVDELEDRIAPMSANF